MKYSQKYWQICRLSFSKYFEHSHQQRLFDPNSTIQINDFLLNNLLVMTIIMKISPSSLLRQCKMTSESTFFH